MPAKVPFHPFNFGTAAATFIKVGLGIIKQLSAAKRNLLRHHLMENCGVSVPISKLIRVR